MKVISYLVVIAITTYIVLALALNTPHWSCDTEDEVVTIDHSCTHVDAL